MAKKYTKHNYDENTFSNNNAISYYLLGCFLTDGNIYKNTFSITSKDLDWMEIIKSNICKEAKLYGYRNCWKFTGTNRNIANWFRLNECIPNKSLIVKLPNIPEQYFPDLIRGLIDGDGSIDPSRNTVYFCSASIAFINSICQILISKNIKYNLIERLSGTSTIRGKIFTRNSSLYKIVVYGTNCYKLLKWIYYSNDILAMPRKQQLAKTIINIFEERGLTLNNILDFNTDQNRNSNKLKITNKELSILLTKWNAIPQKIRNKKGTRKQFYLENVSGLYDINYHYVNRLLSGKQRKNITTKMAPVPQV